MIEALHRKTIDFQNEANEYLANRGQIDLRLFYGGRLASGNMQNNRMLFLGANPGYSIKDDWDNRPGTCLAESHGKQAIKYLEELSDSHQSLAPRIVEIVCGGDKKRLDDCIESSCYSPFASPDLRTLNRTLNALSTDLRNKHWQLVNEIIFDLIRHCNPKVIILVGTTTADTFLGRLNQIDTGLRLEEPFVWKKEQDGNKRRIFAQALLSNGSKLIGCIHLSGARYNRNVRESLIQGFSLM